MTAKSILIVMDSYRGTDGSNAIPPAILAMEHAGKRLTGGVVYMVFVCAFMLQPRQASAHNVHCDHNPIAGAKKRTSDVENPSENFL